MTSVLIVEDEPPAMRLMAWALQEAGMDVLLALDPEGAAELLTNESHCPDLIVLNSEAPVDRKRAWVTKLRSMSHGARIIDLAEDAKSAAHDTGADAYVESPYRAITLVEEIEQLLRIKKDHVQAPGGAQNPFGTPADEDVVANPTARRG